MTNWDIDIPWIWLNNTSISMSSQIAILSKDSKYSLINLSFKETKKSWFSLTYTLLEKSKIDLIVINFSYTIHYYINLELKPEHQNKITFLLKRNNKSYFPIDIETKELTIDSTAGITAISLYSTERESLQTEATTIKTILETTSNPIKLLKQQVKTYLRLTTNNSAIIKENIYRSYFQYNLHECLNECFNDNECTAIMYELNISSCKTYNKHNIDTTILKNNLRTTLCFHKENIYFNYDNC